MVTDASYEPLLVEQDGVPRWSVRHRRRLRRIDGLRPLLDFAASPRGAATVLVALLVLLSPFIYFFSHLPLSEPWLKGERGAEDVIHGDHGPIRLADNPYFQFGSAAEHNQAIAARLERCASLGLLRDTGDRLARLPPDEEARYEAEGCGQNATTVVLLASFWFTNAYGGGQPTGETVWAQSVISTLNHLGYAYMFSSVGWGPKSWFTHKTVELWHAHKRNIRTILADEWQIWSCASWQLGWSWPWQAGRCLQTKRSPGGIPIWKMLSFDWWDEPAHPLGAKFTLSPFPHNDNHFLSFSIEPTCRRLPFRPQAERADPPQAYMHAKEMWLLKETRAFPWTLPFLGSLQERLGISIVGGMRDGHGKMDDPKTSAQFHDAGLTNMGPLTPLEFYAQLWKSFVLIGMGRPAISPSAYDALCMGVPLINPITVWDEKDPDDRSKWLLQHNYLADVGPPYVYPVKAHDLAGLEAAVSAALNHPIESFVRADQTFDFVVDKMAEMLDDDWRVKAEIIVQSRIMSPKGRIFEL